MRPSLGFLDGLGGRHATTWTAGTCDQMAVLKASHVVLGRVGGGVSNWGRQVWQMTILLSSRLLPLGPTSYVVRFCAASQSFAFVLAAG